MDVDRDRSARYEVLFGFTSDRKTGLAKGITDPVMNGTSDVEIDFGVSTGVK